MNMPLQQFLVRHTTSMINPSLIESWCLKCGVFIAASNDESKLQAADRSHSCIHSLENPSSSYQPDGDPRPTR
jgi:hypothetical protein